MQTRSPDFWSGLALAALGGYIVFEARAWTYSGPDGPGPGFFPLWYGIAMLVLSAILVLASKPASVDWKGTGRALLTWAAFAVSVALLKLAGFIIGFAALTFFIVAVMYRRPLVQAVMVAIGVAAGFWLVFPLALNVALP
jgi:putative tricarboxylic transport membrane protein